MNILSDKLLEKGLVNIVNQYLTGDEIKNRNIKQLEEYFKKNNNPTKCIKLKICFFNLNTVVKRNIQKQKLTQKDLDILKRINKKLKILKDNSF